MKDRSQLDQGVRHCIETFVGRAPSKLGAAERNLLEEHREYLSDDEIRSHLGDDTPSPPVEGDGESTEDPDMPLEPKRRGRKPKA